MQTTSDHPASDLLLSTFGYNDNTEAEINPINTLAMTLLRTVIPVIVLMGTVGNTLSFCVLVRRHMRSTPMYFYLTLLAVADTFVLYVSAFKVWIRALTHFEVLHISNVGCKLFMFILLCSFYMSAWLVVLVTLDRFLVVWFPFHGYLLTRIRRARLTAAVLAVAVAVYNVHVFWTISLHQYRSAPTCSADEDDFFMEHVFEYLKLISYCVVPFVIVITLNVGILVRINRVYTNAAMRRDCGLRNEAAVYRHQIPLVVLEPPSTPVSGNVDIDAGGVVWPQRQPPTVSASNSASSANRHQSPLNVQKLRQRRLTKMLLFISFAWLALTAPFTLHSFLPGPSSSSSYSSSSSSSLSSLSVTTDSSKSALSDSTQPMEKSVLATNSTVDRFLYHDNREISQSVFTFFVNSNYLQEATTNSFLPEEHHAWATSATVSSSSMSAGIDPSRYLLVKTICFLLMYVNHAVNFYLYCLTGKRFRKELAAMLNCGRVMLMCRESTDETAAAAAVGVGEIPMHNYGRRDVDRPQQFAGRMQQNQAQPSSTSSRTRSRRMMMMMVNVNPLHRSSSELNDERYS